MGLGSGSWPRGAISPRDLAPISPISRYSSLYLEGRDLTESLEGELLAEIGRDCVELELYLAQRSDHLQTRDEG